MGGDGQGYTAPPMAGDLSGKVVVLGLDGATWDLLRPLAERGVMPNLARALERGRHGGLRVVPAAVQLPGMGVDRDRQEPGDARHLRLLGGRSAR